MQTNVGQVLPTANLHVTPCNPFPHCTSTNMLFDGSTAAHRKSLAADKMLNPAFKSMCIDTPALLVFTKVKSL